MPNHATRQTNRESVKLNDRKHSGNFIDLFKLLSKYDLTLREPKQRINEKQLTQHYLSHDIQNELISLMSKSVIEQIIHRNKQGKYYAFLLDCTRDVSCVEQMSIILRFCNSLTVAEELAASIKSKFQLWHPHGLKNALGFILSILVLTHLYEYRPYWRHYNIPALDSFGYLDHFYPVLVILNLFAETTGNI
ncbi:TTF-type domain-containing protein [Trichonephila clavipes]|nr:TTF-type domain-containing protein [Trichonephila clavipes]